MTSLQEVALLRLAAQHLAGPGLANPADAVRWMTAVQAQDHGGALTSVALRTAAGTRAGVEAALDAGQVVRSRPVRRTLHLLAAEDLRWMLELLAPRVVARGALAGSTHLRRAELFAVWDGAGLDPSGQRGAHVLSYLAMTGTVVLGPTAGGEQLLALTGEWVPGPRRLEREEALGEQAER